MPVLVVGAAVVERQGAAGGGGGRSSGAIPPGRDTSSVRKSTLARAPHRLSKFGLRTCCCLYNAFRELSFNS